MKNTLTTFGVAAALAVAGCQKESPKDVDPQIPGPEVSTIQTGTETAINDKCTPVKLTQEEIEGIGRLAREKHAKLTALLQKKDQDPNYTDLQYLLDKEIIEAAYYSNPLVQKLDQANPTEDDKLFCKLNEKGKDKLNEIHQAFSKGWADAEATFPLAWGQADGEFDLAWKQAVLDFNLALAQATTEGEKARAKEDLDTKRSEYAERQGKKRAAILKEQDEKKIALVKTRNAEREALINNPEYLK